MACKYIDALWNSFGEKRRKIRVFLKDLWNSFGFSSGNSAEMRNWGRRREKMAEMRSEGSGAGKQEELHNVATRFGFRVACCTKNAL